MFLKFPIAYFALNIPMNMVVYDYKYKTLFAYIKLNRVFFSLNCKNNNIIVNTKGIEDFFLKRN